MELESDWKERYFISRGNWLTDHQINILKHGAETEGERYLLKKMEENWLFERTLQEEGY